MRALLVTLVLLAAHPSRTPAQVTDSVVTHTWVRTPSGLEFEVVTAGTGPRVRAGQTVTIHESLALAGGRVLFDSRVAPNKAVTFRLGANQVIRGVEEGVTGMRVGERRRLRVPPALDGRTFDPSFLPPTAIRLYDIELLAVKP